MLGLSDSWEVEDVNFSLTGQRIEVRLRFIGDAVFCSECGLQGTVYDHPPEQQWRHLDKIQFETLGQIGDVVEVKNGFGRNFLIPNKIAYAALKGNIKALAEEKKTFDKKKQHEIVFSYLKVIE